MELAKRQGSLSSPELAVLRSWYEFLDKEMGLDLDLIVYLQATPQVSYDRMRLRGRDEEASIPIDYIRNLHSVYEDWLIHQTFGTVQVPILVLDADKSKEELLHDYNEYKSKIFGHDKLKNGQVVYC